MRPEYQRSIGGSHCTSKKATRNWPKTRRTKSAVSAQRKLALLKHLLVVPVPLALEELLFVVLALELHHLRQARVAGLDLAADGVAVVGREIAAAVLDADVDQAPEDIARLDETAGRVLDVYVEDDARVRPARPGHEALAVLLDEPYGAVDDVDLVAARVFAHFGHEGLE